MSELSIGQILSSKYRTSKVADGFTMTLMDSLGLSTKGSVARLAIGRSLGLGPFPDEKVDAKGQEVPATSMFSTEDVSVWIGLLVSHAAINNQPAIQNMETFRMAVRRHWHRGATLLMEDWKAYDEDFDRFLETLINRRAELPDTAPEPSDGPETTVIEAPKDLSAELVKAIADIGIKVEVKDFTHGPRVTRYKVFLPNINQLDKLKRGLERLSLVLSLQQAMPVLSPGDETKTIFLDIPRPKETWHSNKFDRPEEWTKATPYDPDHLIVYPGIDVMGTPFSFDLAEAPHLLVGGATGQGKSVCLHALILSLIMKHSPDNLQLALLDPKQVEFSVY